jgi:outer membrane protein OmpA-like peptidoglycan-associated protein
MRTGLFASALVVASAVAIPTTSVITTSSAKADTLQMSSDNSSTGWYPNEPLLSPSNVTGGNFGELFDTQLNGEVYAQPLVSQTTVLAVTENDYAYGLNSTTGAIKWQHNFGPQANPLLNIGCADVGSSLGITGTPVIDPSKGIAYFVAAKESAGDVTQWFMEAVNVQTGTTPSNWPAGGVPIQGSADNNPGTVFNGDWQTQRPGLVLINGVVYAAFGSQCDYFNWEGWVVGVSVSAPTPSITTMWSTEECSSNVCSGEPGAGIWQSGSPPVVDSQGNIYVSTGNGDIPSGPEPGNDATANNYGEAVVKLSTSGPIVPPDVGPILRPTDFFIPADAQSLNNQDGDLGSGGPVALPASMGTPSVPNVMLEVGKQGTMYVLNQNNLGGYEQGTNPNGSDDVPSEVSASGGVWSKPAVWPTNVIDGGYVYVPTAGTQGFATNGGSLDVFQESVTNGSFQLAGATANTGNTFGYGSGTPIVTSAGTTSGSALVWIIHATGPSGVDSQLEAFNPIPVNNSLEEVWSSLPFTSTVFSEPGVNNGIVYVGTKDDTLMGFGALASSIPALSGADVNFSATTVSQSVTQNATFTASSTTTVNSFTESGSAYTMGTPSMTLPATLSAHQSITVPVTFTPTALGANLGTLTANATGATSEINLNGQGGTATASFTITPTSADFVPVPSGGNDVTLPITFTNVSSSAINVQGFNSPTLPFTVTDVPTNQTIAPNGTVTFTVQFAPPGSSGDFDHVFESVATLDTSVGNFGVAISGTANPPALLSTAPNVLNFGSVEVGSVVTLNFDLGNQGAFPLLITQSTPPTTNGFSALTDPFIQLANTNPAHTIAPNTSIPETVQFAPTSDGLVSATWLLEGNDGNGVQTVTLTGTGYTPAPSQPPPSGPPPTITTTTATGTTTLPVTTTTIPSPVLSVVPQTGREGSSLTLRTKGDPEGGALSFRVKNGTAKSCAINGHSLTAKSAGTCIVTATRRAKGSTPKFSSKPTIVRFEKSKSSIHSITIDFGAHVNTLNSASKAAIVNFAKPLKNGDTVVSTGYAKGNLALASRRAASVARYLARLVRVHVTLRSVTNGADNKAILAT